MSKRNRERRLEQTTVPTPAADSWLQRAIIWLFHLLLFTTPLYFNMKTDELFEFNKMILVYFFGLIIVGAWAWRMVAQQRWIIRWHWLHWLVVVFFLSQLTSAFTSIHPYTSWLGYYSRFHGGVVSYLAYSLIYLAAVSNLRKKDLLPMGISLLGSAIVVGIWGIFEHFGHSASCIMAGGTFTVECWVQDVQTRVFATFGQPNWMAAYLLMLMPLALWLMASATKIWIRLFGLTSVTTLIWAILYTKSRSGFFGLLLALGIYGLGWMIVWWKHRSPKSLAWTAGGAVIIGSAVLLSGGGVVPQIADVWKREAIAPTPAVEADPNVPTVDRLMEGGTDSGEIRKIVWDGALKVWRRYPILGSGPETFGYAYYLDRPVEHNMVSEWDFLYNRAHNEFLNFLATTGVVGLGSYALLLTGGAWLFFSQFRKKLNEKPNVALLNIALLAGTAGLAVSNFFGFSTVMVTVLQYLFFAAAVLLSLKDQPNSADQKEYTWVQYAQFTVVGVAACILLITLLRYYQADLAYARAKRLAQSGSYTSALSAVDEAIKLNGLEANYWDQLATLLTQAAAATPTGPQQTTLVEASLKSIQMAHALNPQQRNFGKTHTRDYLMLASVDEKYYNDALTVLTEYIEKAPTDAKLFYNRGLVHIQLGDQEKGMADLHKSVELKPNYEPSLFHLANQAAQDRDWDQATQWAEQILRFNPGHPTAPDMIASYSAQKVYAP